jgi:hypothetical protein
MICRSKKRFLVWIFWPWLFVASLAITLAPNSMLAKGTATHMQRLDTNIDPPSEAVALSSSLDLKNSSSNLNKCAGTCTTDYLARTKRRVGQGAIALKAEPARQRK